MGIQSSVTQIPVQTTVHRSDDTEDFTIPYSFPQTETFGHNKMQLWSNGKVVSPQEKKKDVITISH